MTNISGAQIALGGDTILRIDNKTVNTLIDIHSYLDTKNVGDTIQLTIARDNVIKNVGLTLAATPSFMSESSVLQLQPLGMNTFYDTNEFNPGLHVVGEVLNNSTIAPGQKAPFEIIVDAQNVRGGNLNIVRDVSVQVSSM